MEPIPARDGPSSRARRGVSSLHHQQRRPPLFARILGETLPHADVLTHYAKLLKSDPQLEN